MSPVGSVCWASVRPSVPVFDLACRCLCLFIMDVFCLIAWRRAMASSERETCRGLPSGHSGQRVSVSFGVNPTYATSYSSLL